jgi:surface antigen
MRLSAICGIGMRGKVMFKNLSIFIGLVLGSTFFSVTASFADECKETCVSKGYLCVFPYAYMGEDPYDVDRYNSPSPYNQTKHSCTSFVAWMLANFKPWMPEISTFDGAYKWDDDAVSRVGASLVTVPKVGDIAQWEKFDPTDKDDMGHVAYVTSVNKTLTGVVKSIELIDDNGGRWETTKKILYPESRKGTIAWPDHFIRFPDSLRGSSGGGGFIDRVPASVALDMLESQSELP